MNLKLNNSYLIIGTDTDIGKTYATSVLFNSLKDENIGYFKPFQTGCKIDENNFIPIDPDFLCNFCNVPFNKNMVAYLFDEPLSPHLALERENRTIDLNTIFEQTKQLSSLYSTLLIESAGGIYVPIIRDKYHMFNFAQDLNCPIILVCSTKVGAINHTMLTIEFLKSKNLKIQGIIFNNYTSQFYEDDNISVILNSSNISNYLIINHNQKIIEKNKVINFLNNI